MGILPSEPGRIVCTNKPSNDKTRPKTGAHCDGAPVVMKPLSNTGFLATPAFLGFIARTSVISTRLFVTRGDD